MGKRLKNKNVSLFYNVFITNGELHNVKDKYKTVGNYFVYENDKNSILLVIFR